LVNDHSERSTMIQFRLVLDQARPFLSLTVSRKVWLAKVDSDKAFPHLEESKKEVRGCEARLSQN